jgi:hypothetical protein
MRFEFSCGDGFNLRDDNDSLARQRRFSFKQLVELSSVCHVDHSVAVCNAVGWGSLVTINCQNFTAKPLGLNDNFTAKLAGAKHDQARRRAGAWNSELGTTWFAHWEPDNTLTPERKSAALSDAQNYRILRFD